MSLNLIDQAEREDRIRRVMNNPVQSSYEIESLTAKVKELEAAQLRYASRLAGLHIDKNELQEQLSDEQSKVKVLTDALEAAYNGLRWWMDAFPLHVTEADNEEMLNIVKALATVKEIK